MNERWMTETDPGWVHLSDEGVPNADAVPTASSRCKFLVTCGGSLMSNQQQRESEDPRSKHERVLTRSQDT